MQIMSLGQSGFLLEGSQTIVCDPFLGHLEDPAERKKFPRLIEADIGVRRLGSPAVVFVSHHHGDHCHTETLKAIADTSPAAMFVAPKSAADRMIDRGIAPERIICPFLPEWQSEAGIRFFPVPAAHYAFSHRADAIFDYWGYVIELDQHRLFHAGDTILYNGMLDILQKLQITVAFLPINGRNWRREAMGIVGNLNEYESAFLCQAIDCKLVVPCHFEMFAENTGNVGEFLNHLRQLVPDAKAWVPSFGAIWEVPPVLSGRI